MIDALIAGRLTAKPEARSSSAGRQFVAATVRVMPGRGDAIFVRATIFNPVAQSVLLALDAGESVVLSGELHVALYTDGDGRPAVGVSLTAHTVSTVHHVSRQRVQIREATHPHEEVPRE